MNILTHLEYHRVLALSDEGKSVGEAKRQAQGEIFAVFGIAGNNSKSSEDMSIFGDAESDAALLAISVLLLGDLGDGAFSERLADFSLKFKSNGAWGDNAEKTKVADWASGADLAAVKNNVLSWGMSSAVPGFEKYVYNYWVSNYILGVCNAGSLKKNGNALSANKDVYYICLDNAWQVDGCGNRNPDEQFCYKNEIYSKCGDSNGNGKHEYNPDTHFCLNNSAIAKCGGNEYNHPDEVCNGGIVGKLCGGTWFSLATHFCLSGTTPTPLCGGEEYTGSQFCRGGAVYNKCNGNEYEPTHFCSGSTIIEKCGGVVEYTPGTEQCCGSGKYTVASQFCHTDYTVHNKCGGTVEYTPGTEQCCGNNKYTLATQFCYSSSKIGTKCGTRTEIFDPDLYECKPEINANGIYLKMPVSYEGQSYNAVLIGTQTWMAENLNYNATGSKCYGDISGGDSENKCDTYGRLYDWNTAMALASSCNSNSGCSVQTKHKGICPTSWHIPSDAEWTALVTAIGGRNTAGTKLKSATGWNNNGNGTDNYGFSALPGGNTSLSGEVEFYAVGNQGDWWSTTESSSNNTYSQYTQHDNSYFILGNSLKSRFFSVRCLKD